MQSIMGGAVISLFLIALYAPWFTKPSMLVAIVVSLMVNVFLMAGCSGLLPPTGVGYSRLATSHPQCTCTLTWLCMSALCRHSLNSCLFAHVPSDWLSVCILASHMCCAALWSTVSFCLVSGVLSVSND